MAKAYVDKEKKDKRNDEKINKIKIDADGLTWWKKQNQSTKVILIILAVIVGNTLIRVLMPILIIVGIIWLILNMRRK